MRVNVYHEELSDDFAIAWTEPRPGVRYCGLRIFQHSAPELHNRADDDDRSAVTFWVGTLDQAQEFVDRLGATIARERQRQHQPRS